MSYKFAEGYKIRDQSSTHFLTFTVMGCSVGLGTQEYWVNYTK